MTTTTVSKPINTEKSKSMKALQIFALDKIFENATDTIVALVAFSVMVAYLIAMQNVPVSFAECLVYAALIFIGMMMRRVIQDFDDDWTNKEIGNWIMGISKDITDIERMVRNETILTADDDDDEVMIKRINSIANEE